MNAVIITEMAAISVLRLLNVHYLESIIFKKSSKPEISVLFVINIAIYLISTLVFICFELFRSTSRLRIIAFAAFYLFYVLSLLSLEKKIPKRSTLYTCITYLMADSIMQSGLFLLSETIFGDTDRRLIMRSISVILNLAILIILRIIPLKYSTSLMIFDYSIVPKKIYLLILLTLIIMSALLENQLRHVDASDLALQMNISKILTAVTVPSLVVLIIALLIITTYKGYYENSSYLLKKQIETQLEYYKELYGKSEQIKAFRHDFKNHMLSIKGLMDKGYYQEALEYVNNISDKFSRISKEYTTGNKLADAMLSEKCSQAEAVNTSINFEGEICSDIDYADICTILSNALDNAIEACSEIEDHQKSILISCGYKKNIQIIRVSNPTAGDIDIVNGTIATTKQDKSNHGFGLYNIKKTIDKYGGDFNIKYEENTFTLEVGFQVGRE